MALGVLLGGGGFGLEKNGTRQGGGFFAIEPQGSIRLIPISTEKFFFEIQFIGTYLWTPPQKISMPMLGMQFVFGGKKKVTKEKR